MKTLVFQVVIGSPGYAYSRAEATSEFEKYLMPTVSRYCEKHGYDYQLITKYPEEHDPRWFNFNTKKDSYNYRAGGKQKAATLVRYLNLNQPEYDRIVSLDCDIYIPEDADPLPEVKGHMAARDVGKSWHDFRNAFSLPKDTFVNAGVQMVDKDTALKLYKYFATIVDRKIQPPINYKSDQSYMNKWRSENHKTSNILGDEWNYMMGDFQKNLNMKNKNFVHFAGESGRYYLKEALKKGEIK